MPSLFHLSLASDVDLRGSPVIDIYLLLVHITHNACGMTANCLDTAGFWWGVGRSQLINEHWTVGCHLCRIMITEASWYICGFVINGDYYYYYYKRQIYPALSKASRTGYKKWISKQRCTLSLALWSWTSWQGVRITHYIQWFMVVAFFILLSALFDYILLVIVAFFILLSA